MLVLGCSSCVPGLNIYLYPYMPTWTVVFLIWLIFLRKYDGFEDAPRPARWLGIALGMFLAGGFVAIALWSFFYMFWLFRMASRSWECFFATKIRRTETTWTAETEEFRRETARWQNAALYHVQMLILTLVGTTAAGMHFYFKHGVLY